MALNEIGQNNRDPAQCRVGTLPNPSLVARLPATPTTLLFNRRMGNIISPRSQHTPGSISKNTLQCTTLTLIHNHNLPLTKQQWLYLPPLTLLLHTTPKKWTSIVTTGHTKLVPLTEDTVLANRLARAKPLRLGRRHRPHRQAQY